MQRMLDAGYKNCHFKSCAEFDWDLFQDLQ